MKEKEQQIRVSCEKHKKSVGEYTNMKKLAEDIGDLHYESLGELFAHLSEKVTQDGEKDIEGGRKKLGETLLNLGWDISMAYIRVKKAWLISKPFMKEK